jgi:hypothetical protein
LHFEENHSKEDQAFLQSIKDLFGKAKKKILSDEDQGCYSKNNTNYLFHSNVNFVTANVKNNSHLILYCQQ